MDLSGIILACPIAVSREACKICMTSLTGSLLLDDGYYRSMF